MDTTVTFKQCLKRTVSLAWPMVIGQLGHIMMGVMDSLMVGRIGPTPLAAASLAGGLFFLVLVVGLGITYAITPLTAMADGAGDHRSCGRVFRHGWLVSMSAGVILAGITFLVSFLIPYLNQPPDVAAEAMIYLDIMGFSILPVMLFQVYRQFSEGISKVIPPMVVTLLANLVNIFFNWMFIFGNLGFPAMGLAGAGWATFITRSCMAIGLLWYIKKSAVYKPYEPTLKFKRVDKKIIKDMLHLGLASGFQYFFEVGAFSGAAVMVGWLGTTSLAAHQIALNLASITFMFVLGISMAASIRVGNAVGRHDREGTRRAGFSALALAWVVMSCSAAVFILARFQLPTLYIQDDAVIQIAASLLIVAAVFQISDGTQAVGLGVLRGMADVRVPTLITFIAYWLVGLPVGYLLGFHFDLGVRGIWIGLLLALTASGLMLSLRFNSLSRRVR